MSLNFTLQAPVRQVRTACSFADDNSFGPSVARQCRAFDFTLLFEQAFLSLVPSILLVLGCIYRLNDIVRQDVKTLGSRLHNSKLVPYSCTHSAYWVTTDEPRYLQAAMHVYSWRC